MNRIFSLILVSGLSAGLSQHALAQDSGHAALVAAAQKEGKVTFYLSDVVTVGQRVVEGFKKAYPGIEVEVFRATGATLIPRLDQERASGTDSADVVLTDELRWLEARSKEGSLVKPSANVTSRWPARFVYHGSVYIATIDPLIIMYNKTIVKNAPKSYADLLAPEYKDKIGTSNLAATSVVAFYDWAEKTFGSDYLTRLKAQNPKFYNGGTPLSQAVASGEIAANGLAAVPSNAKAMLANGAPIGYVVPNPGIGIAFAVSAVAWAKHPNAGRLLVDYILSPEGQAVYNGTGESASPLPGVPGSLDASTVTPWDPDAYPPEVVKAYTAHFNSVFNK